MGHVENNRANAMAALRNDMIALAVVAGGQFDDRIKQLTDIQADIDHKLEALGGVDKASGIIENAKSEAATILASASAAAEKAAKTMSVVEERAEDVLKQAKSVAQATQANVATRIELEKQRSGLDVEQASLDTMRVTLQRRLAEVEEQSSLLLASRTEVESMKRTLTDRLAALAIA